MNFLGLLKIVAFSFGIAILKLLDFFSHKHFESIEATFSIVCLIAAIASVKTGSYLDLVRFHPLLLLYSWLSNHFSPRGGHDL